MGVPVLKLQTGDPEFATHPEVVEAACASIAAGDTHYTTSRGLIELREAIAERYRIESGTAVDPGSEVLVTTGAAQGLYLALASLVSPGDKVALLEPCYPQYGYVLQVLGAIPVPIPADRDMLPDVDALERAAGAGLAGVIVNTPNNPSGVVYSTAIVDRLAEICGQKGIWLLADEVYRRIVDELKQQPSMLAKSAGQEIIVVDSFSKTYAMTGWRLGYVVARPELISTMLKLMQLNTTCVPEFVQRAGLKAISSPTVSEYALQIAATYARRRQSVWDLIEGTPLEGPRASGAIYQLLHVGLSDPDQVLEWIGQLLDQESVAVVPGFAYGTSSAEYVRISITGDEDDVLEGVRRVLRFDRRWRSHDE